MKTYFRPAGFEAVEVPVLPNGRTDFSKIPDDVLALVVQYPNFAGVIEDLEVAAKAAHDKKILLIASFSEAMAWGLLKNPGSCGADIVCGEGSSFGIPLSAGSPGVGMLACFMKNVRSVPGRLVRETTDKNSSMDWAAIMPTASPMSTRFLSGMNPATGGLYIPVRIPKLNSSQ